MIQLAIISDNEQLLVNILYLSCDQENKSIIGLEFVGYVLMQELNNLFQKPLLGL